MSRLSINDAVKLIKEAPLKELGKMALDRKRELHPKKITTFVVDRNINYTNICFVDCKFCAFKRKSKMKIVIFSLMKRLAKR